MLSHSSKKSRGLLALLAEKVTWAGLPQSLHLPRWPFLSVILLSRYKPSCSSSSGRQIPLPDGCGPCDWAVREQAVPGGKERQSDCTVSGSVLCLLILVSGSVSWPNSQSPLRFACLILIYFSYFISHYTHYKCGKSFGNWVEVAEEEFKSYHLFESLF